MNMYKEAIEIQNACNISGVVKTFARIIDEIWIEAREQGKGTEYVNNHPVCKLFADKLADLSNVRSFDEYSKAFEQCEMKTMINPENTTN